VNYRWLFYVILFGFGLASYALMIASKTPVAVKIAGGELGSAALFVSGFYFLRRLPERIRK